jgi:hypothetical protein
MALDEADGMLGYAGVCRIQAALGNTMAAMMPRAQLVPVVDPDNLHPDKTVVSSTSEGS